MIIISNRFDTCTSKAGGEFPLEYPTPQIIRIVFSLVPLILMVFQRTSLEEKSFSWKVINFEKLSATSVQAAF